MDNDRVQVCLKKAEQAAVEILKRLNDAHCRRLEELYVEKGNKMMRQKDLFDKLGYISNHKNNFKGLYVFGKEKGGKTIPVYVGISRNAFQRLRQHGWGKRDNECTLAYLIEKGDYKGARKDFKKLEEGKTKVRKFKVAMIPELDDYDLYFMEVAIAGILKTKWNDFKTH